LCGAPPQGLKKNGKCVKRRATIRYEGRARREARVPVVETVHEMFLFAGLDSGRVRDDRGIEEGAALLGFGGALREESLLVLRRHPGITPGLPHMRLADIEVGLRHERAPPYMKPHTKHIQHIFHQRAPFKQRKPRQIDR
jgi:hypothetical protein